MSQKKRKIVKFSSESIKGLPFCLRFFVIFGFFFLAFVLFFVLAILIFFGILLFQDEIDIKGSSFEKNNNFLSISKIGNYDISFGNIIVGKSKKSFVQSALSIRNLVLKSNYVDLKIKEADLQIAPLEILSGNFLRSIGLVKDFDLNINAGAMVLKDKKKRQNIDIVDKNGDYLTEIKNYSNIITRKN